MHRHDEEDSRSEREDADEYLEEPEPFESERRAEEGRAISVDTWRQQ